MGTQIKTFSSLGKSSARITVLLLLQVALVGAFWTSPAWAKGHNGSPLATGNDVSYPQCGKSFPSGQAFGIVGVNDGLANNANPCLANNANPCLGP